MSVIEMLSSTTNVGYDKNLTSLFGRAYSKPIDGKNCLGPGLTKFVDLATPFATPPLLSGVDVTTDNGRRFTLSTVVGGVASVVLSTFNFATGQYTVVGRILVTIPNQGGTTTHTIRYIRVEDPGTTGWKIYFGTVAATTVINGGDFLVNKVDLADFTFNITPVQFFMQITNNAKGTYFLQDPTAMGSAHNNTTLIGGATRNNDLFAFKGSAASLSIYGFDKTVAPTVTTFVSTAPTVPASPTFTVASHGLVANTPLVQTFDVPGGFTQSTGANVQVVYYVRATNLTANTFELSLTPGGAAINATTAASPSFCWAFGITTNAYLAPRKTGVIVTGYSGTALLVDAINAVVIQDSPYANDPVIFFPTTTNFYCFRISEIVAGITSIPSSTVNNLGTGTDYTAITNVNATYMESIQKIVYVSATFNFYAKSWVNNNISHNFGAQISTYLENKGRDQDYFRGFALTGLSNSNGWAFATMNTVGQRGFLAIDLRSDATFNYSKVIGPVTKVGAGKLKFIQSLEKLFDVTETANFRYRTAATENDPVFDTDTSGTWILIQTAEDLSAYAVDEYAQVEVTFNVMTPLSGIPTQIYQILLGNDLDLAISPNWVGSVDNSTKNGESPGFTAFCLIKAYDSVVPEMIMEARDKVSKVLILSKSTVADAADFDFSTTNGSPWTPLGVIPNVINTTEVRYRWGGAIPQDVIISWKEA